MLTINGEMSALYNIPYNELVVLQNSTTWYKYGTFYKGYIYGTET